VSFTKFLQREESHFHNMHFQFTAGLGARLNQFKTVAIQRHIARLEERYYDSFINTIEYLDGLSFTGAKQTKRHFIIFYLFLSFDLYMISVTMLILCQQ